MSLINLLPHRAEAKKLRQTIFKRHLGYCALIGLLVALAIELYIQEKITAQQKISDTLQTQLTVLDGKIKDGHTLQESMQALLVRQHAVDDLQSERNTPVYLMTELAKQLPAGVYITSLRMEKSKVTLKGVSPSNEKVADFLQNIGADSTWFTRPELLEVVAGYANLPPKSARKVSSFSLLFHLTPLRVPASARPLAPN